MPNLNAADSSLTGLYYLEETVFGTTPAAALKQLRYTGESIDHQIDNRASQEINPDRAQADTIQVGAQANGDVNFEWSYQDHDDIIAFALMNDWGAALSITGAITAVNATNQFTSTALFAAIQVGQFIKTGGFTNAANNGIFKVIAKPDSSTITVSGGTLADEAGGGDETIDGETITNGTTKKSFSLEKDFSDVSLKHGFKGNRIDQLSFNLRAGEIATGTFSILGLGGEPMNASSIGTGAPTAATENTPLNAVGNVAQVFVDGEPSDIFWREGSFNLQNSLRGQAAIGNLNFVGIGVGQFVCEGSLVAYFEDATLYNKYRNATELSIAFNFLDGDGNQYVVSFPRLKFERARNVAGGNNEDRVLEITFRGLKDASGKVVRFDRFPVA